MEGWTVGEPTPTKNHRLASMIPLGCELLELDDAEGEGKA
jgi:hypothetical protein